MSIFYLVFDTNTSKAFAQNLEPCSKVSEWIKSNNRFEIAACEIHVRRISITPAQFEKIPGIKNAGDIKLTNKSINLETENALNQQITVAIEKLKKDRRNTKSNRFVRGCLNADSKDGSFKLFDSCSIRRSNTPNTIGASQGAQLSFTRNLNASEDNDEQKNVFNVALALRGTKGIDKNTSATFATEYQRNNSSDAEQDNLNAALGLLYDISSDVELTTAELLEKLIDGESRDSILNDYYSIRLSSDISYNRRGVFGDEDSQACLEMPTAEFCDRQNLETIRIVGNVSPYLPVLNGVSVNKQTGKGDFAWSVSPVAGIFYDDALNDNVELESGNTVDGSVLGLTGGVSASLSPSVFNNRWQLGASAQIIEALDRSSGRVEDFEGTSRQFTSTLSYALIDEAYIGQTTSNHIIPAISLVYTNGSDSLRGRSSRQTLELALTILY